MFILYSIWSGLKPWSVDQTSIYENSGFKVFENNNFLGEILNNWPNGLLETNLFKTLDFCLWLLLTILHWTKTTSVIFKWRIFSPFLFLVILLLVLSSNFIVSGIETSK